MPTPSIDVPAATDPSEPTDSHGSGSGSGSGSEPIRFPLGRRSLLLRSTNATRAIVLSIAVVAAALLVACASSPPTASAGASKPTDNATGSAIYAERCASCHGVDLRGTDKGPPHLSKVYEPGHHSDASFRSAILKGARRHHFDFGDMPPVVGLTDQEVTAVIAYIRETQQREGFLP